MSAVEPRYAEALLQTAENRQQAEKIGKTIEEFSSLLQSSTDLKFFMLNPVIPIKEKKTLLKQLMQDDAPLFAQNFLMLLVDKGRLVNLTAIVDTYNRMMAQQNGVLIVRVISAKPLTQDELDEIAETYRKKHGAEQVQINVEVNAKLLGGIKVQIGDVLTDDSIYGRLQKLTTAIGQ